MDIGFWPGLGILGIDDVPLVMPRPVIRVGIDRTKIDASDLPESSQALARLMDIDPEPFMARVAAAGSRAFVEALVVRDDGSYPLDDDQLTGIPGAVGLPDDLPLAPTRDFARPILGAAGPATAERIQQAAGRLSEGDITGLSGLQREHDEQLRGQVGAVVKVVTLDGQARELTRFEPRDGEPVRTTFDPDIQMRAEALLAQVAPASAIVAIRPSTGDVLAAASGPGGQGYSTATRGQYAPGSTFKIVTALALLRAGLSLPTEVDCTDTADVDGRSFKNYGDYPQDRTGPISLESAIANSCNTALIKLRDHTPQPALAGAAAALGLQEEFQLGVPSFAGSVPTDGGQTEHAAAMIGQGQILVSPLAMAVMTASVANGAPINPRIIRDINPDASHPRNPLTIAEADQLRQMMRAAVTSGSATFLADLPAPEVAAKTGTAEYGDEQPPRTHAWMIAIRGDLAATVFVEDGSGGAGTAGPIMTNFLAGIDS